MPGAYIPTTGVERMVECWKRTQAHLLQRAAKLGPDELRLKGSTHGWPIWAIFGHISYARVFWLCGIAKEPGAETTPFRDPFGDGWEDRLDVERTVAELLAALESSGRIVGSCPQRWTPEMLGEIFIRESIRGMRQDSRQSALTEVVMHDAFHCGELALILGVHGLRSIDPWTPLG